MTQDEIKKLLAEVEKGKALLNELVEDHKKQIAELKDEIERLNNLLTAHR